MSQPVVNHVLVQSELMCLQGYGPAVASAPATISLSPRHAHYVNDGNSKLLMTVHVQDQAGNPISSG